MGKWKKSASVSKIFLYGIDNKKFYCSNFLVLEETKHYNCVQIIVPMYKDTTTKNLKEI